MTDGKLLGTRRDAAWLYGGNNGCHVSGEQMSLPFDRGHLEEVTDRSLSLYLLRGRIVIRLNCQDLFQAASVQ